MSEQRIQVYDLYMKAWSAVSDEERTGLLERSLTEGIVFITRAKTRHGYSDIAEHLQGFQIQFPGGSFRLNNMVGFGPYVLVEWQLVDSRGEPGFTGYDVLTFAEDGRIANILMFTNVAQQKIIWHRRASVEL